MRVAVEGKTDTNLIDLFDPKQFALSRSQASSTYTSTKSFVWYKLYVVRSLHETYLHLIG